MAEGQRVRWSRDAVSYERPANRDVAAAARWAAEVWSNVDCSTANLTEVEPSTSVPSIGDRRNQVIVVTSGWEGRGFAPDAAATTEVRYLEGGDEDLRIVEADIFLNAEGFDFSLEPTGRQRSLLTTILHEMGHVLGLLHPCEPAGEGGAPVCTESHQQSVLFPLETTAGSSELSDDDALGLCHLYGPVDCGVDHVPRDSSCVPKPCEDASECELGRCVRGVCTPAAPELGDPCLVDSECAAGHCGRERVCTVGCEATCPEGFACGDSICELVGAAYGESCSAGLHCASGLCLLTTHSGGTTGSCTRSCAERACPLDDGCDFVESGAVCVPRKQSAGGCSVSRVGRWSAWPLLVLMVVARRRRKGSGA